MVGGRKVYFSVFGSGLGHATRMLDVSERLKAHGCDYRFSTFGQAFGYIGDRVGKDNIVESPSIDVEWSESGGFSSAQFLPKFRFMLVSFLRQAAFENRTIRRYGPSVVVSDSRLSPVLAGRRRSLPIVTMLNQFKVALPPRFQNKVGGYYERIAGEVLGLLWSLSDEVLMTDLPAPYTIGEANLSRTALSRIVKFVGFTSPEVVVSQDRIDKARRVVETNGRPLVFCQISGPEATKEKLVDTITKETKLMTKQCDMVISLGNPHGSTQPKRLGEGLWLFEWCPIKDELFQIADLVIARAGHRTIGQCIDSGKPAVLIPIHNHSEQIGNAEKFSKLGLGVGIRAEKLTPQNLAESVDLILSDDGYRKNVAKVQAVSRKYNGLERSTEIIASYA